MRLALLFSTIFAFSSQANCFFNLFGLPSMFNPVPKAPIVSTQTQASQKIDDQVKNSFDGGNLLKNGNFRVNRLSGRSWLISNQLQGWDVQSIQLGVGSVYNKRWGNSIVVELDGDKNDWLRQKLILSPGTYTLQLQYAPRTGYINTCGMSIRWNNKNVKTIMASDEQINKLSLNLQAVKGQNVLEIRGEGRSDTNGMTIANLKLFSNKSESKVNSPDSVQGPYIWRSVGKNLFVNGDFQNPFRNSGNKILNSLFGWKVKTQIEQGVGNFYNSRWGKKMVIELDGNQNNIISQTVALQKGQYRFEVDYAARANYVKTSSFSLHLNGESITRIDAKDEKINTYGFNFLVSNAGQFTFEIRGEGNSDGMGMTVGAVYLFPIKKQVSYDQSEPCIESQI